MLREKEKKMFQPKVMQVWSVDNNKQLCARALGREYSDRG